MMRCGFKEVEVDCEIDFKRCDGYRIRCPLYTPEDEFGKVYDAYRNRTPTGMERFLLKFRKINNRWVRRF